MHDFTAAVAFFSKCQSSLQYDNDDLSLFSHMHADVNAVTYWWAASSKPTEHSF